MDLELKDKVAVITGGSTGIGLAIAEGFAREGVHLVLSARTEEKLNREAQKISDNHNVDVVAVSTDVSKAEEIDSLIGEIKQKFQGCDILINNAGTGSEEKIMEASDEKWQYYWDLHVMAAVRLSRHLVPLMKKRNGGIIINNASICAKQPLGYEPIYNTTKAALSMFSKCLAEEVIGDNIRVNTVNPGLILTEDWKKTATALGKKEGVSAEQYLDRLAKDNTPIGRFATTEELADFFVFLSSPRASYCVGSTFYVDGGWLKVVN